MRLLLDTHVFLWAVSGSPLLKSPARRLIATAEEVFVSAASIWEIAIKARLGKIAADARTLAAAIEPSGFRGLPITVTHAAGVGQLQLHHSDPFDRILIAQALAEPLKLATADQVLAQYSDIVIVV